MEEETREKEEQEYSAQEVQERVEEKKDKIVNWLKNPYNLAFLALIIFLFAIRLYYFILTKNQPIWWDEGEYVSAAKSYAGIIDYKLQGIRLPAFPLLVSVFFMIGIKSEPLLRFLVLFIPAIASILLLYLCVKEMYPDKRIALISTAIFVVLWEHLFFSNRFHTENLALIFQFLAIWIFFKSTMKKEKIFFIKPKYSLLWIILFSVLSVLSRPGNVVFIPALFLFFLIINKSKIFNKKGLIIIGSLVVVSVVVLVMFWTEISAHPFMVYYFQTQNPLAWNDLGVFSGYYKPTQTSPTISWIPSVLYYSFLFGIVIFLVDIFINFGKIKRIKNNAEDLTFKSDLFNFLILLCVMAIFIFIIRPTGYDFRWFFPLIIGMFVFTSKGMITFSEYVGMGLKNKKVVPFLILIILVLGLFIQLVHADMIINLKKESYLQVKESGLWMKEHSNPSDIIVTASFTQHSYYAEREIHDFHINGSNENETLFNEKFYRIKPRYLVVSVFEPGFTPQWAYDWPERNSDLVTPVQVYFLDPQQTQIALVVYEVNQSKFNL
jgi:hypothetical protein